LIADSAGSFASRLARGLAFAATAGFYGALQILRTDSFDMSHWDFPPF